MPPPLTLAVFAKSPAAGQVKTRLCPPLTGDQAARLYAACVHDTVRKAQAASGTPPSRLGAGTPPSRLGSPPPRAGEEALAPATASAKPAPPPGDTSSPARGGGEPRRAGGVPDAAGVSLYHAGDPGALQHLLSDLPPVAWRPQGGGDLGARLARVPAPCLILGTDSPHLPVEFVEEALDARHEFDVVLGPADDGGYYLIALRAPQPALFAGVAWSTPDVLAQTLDRAAAADLRVHRLPPFYDLDTGADLRRLRDDLAAGRVGDCPATQAALEALGGLVPGV